MPLPALGAHMIACPKEYQSSNWGTTLSVSDVWQGPMDELLAYRNCIALSYTTTQLTPTKGGHGRLVATITGEPGTGNLAPPAGDITIEVEWMELRLPVETNPAFNSLDKSAKAIIRKGAQEGTAFSDLPPMVGDIAAGKGQELYNLIAGGTSEYSTGVPVVRKTTKNASALEKGSAWMRDLTGCPVTLTGWHWVKSADRRVKVGHDIQKIEEWLGSKAWDTTLYPVT